jgi:bifunctional UDP-N-acetylglucosamine pyrophosphorylase / glucosamine-1-phosphate N-acetyltransferase
MSIQAIVLAGGRGKRMNSDKPKVVLPLGGKPMLYYTIRNLKRAGFEDIIIVVGFKADEVKKTLEPLGDFTFAKQAQPLGTADALKTGMKKLDKVTETILVVNGDDSAFYKKETLKAFVDSHIKHDAAISMLTTQVPEGAHLGRVVRDKDNEFDLILEHPEYVSSGLSSTEVNCGAYVFNVRWVKQNISLVEPSELSGEYYIISLLNIAKSEGSRVNLFQLSNPDEWQGVNTPEDLEKANKLLEKTS